MRKVVTIDGLAASGKSTLARLLAKSLGFCHINTGLLYRAVAYLVLNEVGARVEEPAKIVQLIQRHNLRFNYSDEAGSRLLIDDSDLTDSLQSQEVASLTSKLAAMPEVREALRKLQVEAFPGTSIVAEGRDMGTVIFPDAAVKFFITGDPIVRASRRAVDLSGQITSEELEKLKASVAAELRERDERDTTRNIAPLKPADDAIPIDNSVGELSQTVNQMVSRVLEKISGENS